MKEIKQVELTSTSRVRGISKILLAPAQKTAIGVRPNSIRSAEISIPASQHGSPLI